MFPKHQVSLAQIIHVINVIHLMGKNKIGVNSVTNSAKYRIKMILAGFHFLFCAVRKKLKTEEDDDEDFQNTSLALRPRRMKPRVMFTGRHRRKI